MFCHSLRQETIYFRVITEIKYVTNLHTLVYSNDRILSLALELTRSSRICGLLTSEKSQQLKFKSQELVQILFHDVWYLITIHALSFSGKNEHHANFVKC